MAEAEDRLQEAIRRQVAARETARAAGELVRAERERRPRGEPEPAEPAPRPTT
jgi:hypothetical protein